MDWQSIVIALISAIPPTVGAWLAYQKAGEAKAASVAATTVGTSNAEKLQEVATKTDGMSTALAEATRKEGFGAGVKQEQDAATATAADAARQAQMIEAIVQRLLAAQTAILVPAAAVVTPDPGPVTAGQISAIKTTVDDIQPRVVDIESATVNVSDKVKAIASDTDDRLATLEKGAPN